MNTDQAIFRNWQHSLEALIERHQPETILCWGTGAMALDVDNALGDRIDHFIDNNPARQGTLFCGKPVKGAGSLHTVDDANALVLVSSMYDSEIIKQIAESEMNPSLHVFSVRSLHEQLSNDQGPLSIDLAEMTRSDAKEIEDCLHDARGGAAALIKAKFLITNERPLDWWELKLFEAGFRKSVRHVDIQPEAANPPDMTSVERFYEKVPDAAWKKYPMAVLKAERNLHMDMLRESGRRSWAHLARYALALECIGPDMLVLDAACGLGYGSAIIASKDPSTRVIGLDISQFAIEYAKQNFSADNPSMNFQSTNVAQLAFIADHCIDTVASFETLEHLVNPEAFLRELKRVLKPGGRMVLSVPNLWIDAEGRNPYIYHLHVYDWLQVRDQIGRYFQIEKLYRQNAGGGNKCAQPDSLYELYGCIPSPEDERDAEWWIVVARA